MRIYPLLLLCTCLLTKSGKEPNDKNSYKKRSTYREKQKERKKRIAATTSPVMYVPGTPLSDLFEDVKRQYPKLAASFKNEN